MARPSSKKRFISASLGSRRTRSSTKKEIAERSGNFQTQARRADIVRKDVAAGPSGIRCVHCGAIFHDKHWHSRTLLEMPNTSMMASALKDGWCDECRWERLHASRAIPHSGEVILVGPFVPQERREILHLIRNVGHRAMERDPEDRVVHIADEGDGIRVFTSENQLAVSIGKQVDHARKGGKLEIVWSKTDKPVLVKWMKKAS